MPGATLVGRAREVSVLARLLDDDAPRPCVFVHGPGGIGKSALLTEFVRMAEGSGQRVVALDGREANRAQTAVETVIADAGPTLLVVDTGEEAPALDPLLREALRSMPATGGRLVVASRRAPDAGWTAPDLEGLVLELAVAPLVDRAALELLAARGVPDARREALAAWAAGHPLSLAVAADAVLADTGFDVAALDADALLAGTLLRRMARDELDGADREVIAVAATARAVDAQLLEAAVPGVDGEHAEGWLRSLSFAEPLGSRVTLHARMRSALVTTLAAEDPDADRDRRRRIADHTYARIARGERRQLADLAEMVADPALRWGIAPVQMTHRVAQVRPGDDVAVAEALGAGGTGWWPAIQRWFDEAPEHILITRDAHGEMSGWGLFVTPRTAPAWAHEDPVVASWLADAAAHQPDGDALMLRDSGDLPIRDVAASQAMAAGNFHMLLGVDLPSVRRTYARARADDTRAREFLLAADYTRAPHLDGDEPDRAVESYVRDWGPGGLFAAAHGLALATLGLPAGAAPELGAGPVAVRDALRAFHDPAVLSESPLAEGTSTAERSDSVQRVLRDATAAAFGEAPDDRLRALALRRGYMDPDANHASAALELHLSRATYYRRLAEARARLEAYLT